MGEALLHFSEQKFNKLFLQKREGKHTLFVKRQINQLAKNL
jgi:hypothetical protein